jgi:hypothetical protein
MEKGLPSFIPDELDVLRNANNVIWLREDDGVIDDYIHYKVTGAHSPLHQVFWIKENNETVFFGADDAPQLQQMKHRFVAKYDFDGKFYHDVRNPVYKF